MYIIHQYSTKNNARGEIEIISDEKYDCPVCGGHLTLRSSKDRGIKDLYGNAAVVWLRIMECEKCGKTHRELPDFIIPYKRYTVEAIASIMDGGDICACENSTCNRLSQWVKWFVEYAKRIAESLKEIHTGFTPDIAGKHGEDLLKYLVRIVVNSNFWRYNRSAFYDSA